MNDLPLWACVDVEVCTPRLGGPQITNFERVWPGNLVLGEEWLAGWSPCWLVGLLVKAFYFLCVLGSGEMVGMNGGGVCHVEE